MKTKLFLSYASEDSTFAEDLHAILEQDFDVWFAPLKLVVGHSLLEEIGKGLAQSDFGIVILSHSYFRKEWTKNELDGLVALEDETRKVVLPVWLGVQKSDVGKFSPILAGRIGSIASRGVDVVAEDIRKAIQQLKRAEQLNPLQDIAFQIADLAELASDFADREKLLKGKSQPDRVRRACEDLVKVTGVLVEALRVKLPNLKIQWTETERDLTLFGQARAIDRYHLIWSIVNARHPGMCVARLKIWEPADNKEGHTLVELEYTPTIKGGEVCWVSPHEEPATPAAVAKASVTQFMWTLRQYMENYRQGIE